jgi:nitroreductase
VSLNASGDPSAVSPPPSIFDILETQRAVRRLRPDPIPDEIVTSLVHFATRAPSAGNRQPWEFVVITDPDLRARVGELYEQASRRLFGYLIDNSSDEGTRRIYEDALQLTDHIGEAPALILVCTQVSEDRALADQLTSILPAVQNLMLAARAYGLGSTLTTVHKRRDQELKALLSIPEHVETVCLIPIGYPQRPELAFRRTTNRRPLAELLHWNRFGESVPGTPQQ